MNMVALTLLRALRSTAFRRWVIGAIPSDVDRISPSDPGWAYGNRVLSGPAKRNLTMRCIIQAFPLSKAPAHWLLDREKEPIRLLSCAAVRL